MDALTRTWQQLAELFRGMSPSQRLTLVAVPIVLLAAFGVLAWQKNASSYVPLSWGKVFTIDQLRSAEQTLIEAGLTEFRTEGQRILVPASDVERYNAALLVDGNLPSDSMSEFEKQFEKSSVFTSREQLQTLKEIALRNVLRDVLRAVPDIEDASVTWARSEARRWPDRGGRVTATVSLRSRRGRPLEPRTVRSIRAAVASMIPDLSPDDVTVFDQSTATAYTGDRDGDPFDDKLVRWIEDHTEQYRRRISTALAYIPDVIVSVQVDVENLKSQIVREQLVDAKKVVPVESEERRRSTTTTERATAAEPGAASNVPRQLQMAAAPTRSSSDTDDQNSSKVVPSFTVTEKEFLTAMPKAVHVSVSIPERYFRDVALARGLQEGASDAEKAAFRQQVEAIRKEEEEKVRNHAMTLIPAGSPEDAVNVTSVTRLEPKVVVTAVPWSEGLYQLARQWGGTAALALLGMWGLWTLGRSLPRAAPGFSEVSGPSLAVSVAAEADSPVTPPPTKRDVLQGFVRDNPEATAAVIGKWIQAAK
jgi:flagellar M-ring protein FliF